MRGAHPGVAVRADVVEICWVACGYHQNDFGELNRGGDDYPEERQSVNRVGQVGGSGRYNSGSLVEWERESRRLLRDCDQGRARQSGAGNGDLVGGYRAASLLDAGDLTTLPGNARGHRGGRRRRSSSRTTGR